MRLNIATYNVKVDLFPSINFKFLSDFKRGGDIRFGCSVFCER